MPTPRIIHISDTHFTNSSRTLDGFSIDYQNSKQKSALIANYLINNKSLLRSNIVVITGDVTDSADVADLNIAKSFISLITRYGYRVYSIPGNHDCSKEGVLAFGQTEFGQSNSRRENFIQYITPNYSTYPYVINLDDGYLILLDSLLGEMRSNNIITGDRAAQGKLGSQQLEDLQKKVNDLQVYRRQGKKVFVALHHSPFDLDPDGWLDDAPELLRIIGNKVDCLLFGHTTPSGIFQQSFPDEEQIYNIPVINCENLEHDHIWVGEELLGRESKQVCVGSNLDGRLEIFYIGTNNNIYHRWQLNPNGEWGDESEMGGGAKQICVGQNLDGRLEIFYAGTNNRIYHRWQLDPNSGWGDEAEMGGEAKQICVGQNLDGRLEIFYVGTNNRIYHRWQLDPNSGWGDESEMGGEAKQICVARNLDGRLEIFYVGTNNHIYHRCQLNPNSGWGDEAEIGGEAKQICVGQNSDGRLEIFYVGTNNHVYHNWQLTANSLNWNGEVSMGSEAKQICVGQNLDGRLEILYIGTNDALYHDFMTEFGWRGEETLSSNDSGKQICIGRNQDGRLETFYVGTNSKVYHNYQAQPNSGALPLTVIDLDAGYREIYMTDSTIPARVPIPKLSPSIYIQPVVSRKRAVYDGRDASPAIKLLPGAKVNFIIGGGVQTGGTGDTWKRYVNPSGSGSGDKYYGTIYIPGITLNGPEPIRDLVGKYGSYDAEKPDRCRLEFTIPQYNTQSTSNFLELGYEDDGYGDNGYYAHDNGKDDQCKDIGAAYVNIIIS